MFKKTVYLISVIILCACSSRTSLAKIRDLENNPVKRQQIATQCYQRAAMGKRVEDYRDCVVMLQAQHNVCVQQEQQLGMPNPYCDNGLALLSMAMGK